MNSESNSGALSIKVTPALAEGNHVIPWARDLRLLFVDFSCGNSVLTGARFSENGSCRVTGFARRCNRRQFV